MIAGWLRYLLGVDDNGNEFVPSSDPMLETARNLLGSVAFGDTDITPEQLKALLSNEVIFGVDLYAAGLSERIAKYFCELNAGCGAVRETLKKYV